MQVNSDLESQVSRSDLSENRDYRNFDTRTFMKEDKPEVALSDLVNSDEKDEIFRHSMSKGLFNDIKKSPLKDKMPKSMQFYDQEKDMRSFPQKPSYDQRIAELEATFNASPQGKEMFPKFVPRHKKGLNKGLDVGKDFTINAVKFFCKERKHKEPEEVEFVCTSSKKFYCKRCLPQHDACRGNDLVIAQIVERIQNRVTNLKHEYATKKETLITKLDSHQAKMEDLFKIYYDTIDAIRHDYLEQEYTMRAKMDYFERDVKKLMSNLSGYSLIEYYLEKDELNEQVSLLFDQLGAFNVYLPNTRIIVDDMNKIISDIKVDLRERVHSQIAKIDHGFALKNYEHILKEVRDETINRIYM